MADRSGIYFGTIQGADLVPSIVAKGKSASAESGFGTNSHLEAAIRAGNVNTSESIETEVLQLSESSQLAQEKHAQLLRRMEAEKRARSIAVPTSVDEVTLRLRQLQQPITLFGERPADRRERLRDCLSKLQLEAEDNVFVRQMLEEMQQQSSIDAAAAAASVKVLDDGTAPSSGGTPASTKPTEDQLFYIPIKTNDLKQARAAIFTYASERTAKRLKQERLANTQTLEEKEQTVDRHAAQLYVTAQKMVNVASQNGDVRPMASVRYSSDASHVATGSWSSLVKVWDAKSAAEVKVFRGHEDRITGLAWHPMRGFSDMSDQSDAVCLCSGSADSTARLWSAARNEPLAVLKGHRARLAKVEFHPSGDYVGTTSFDHTWRLWDVTTAQELLLQEGHYKEVYAIAFQKDGALAATGDLNGIGRVWDLRSGKAILPLQGHSKQILSMDFSTNGYELASGSDDRSVRIWDLRQRKCSYVIPAHSNLVSDVRFSPESSELLLTASYDATLKLWRSRDWALVATLRGHDGKVMAADFARDEKHIVSCGFDRTFKFWAHEQEF